MRTPFLKASCGCIVIPLHRESTTIKGMMDCVIIRACDGEGDWHFSIRCFEPWKVQYEPAHKYSENSPIPAPLSEDQTLTVINAIGKLVTMGNAASSISGLLGVIQRCDYGRPKELLDDPQGTKCDG